MFAELVRFVFLTEVRMVSVENGLDAPHLPTVEVLNVIYLTMDTLTSLVQPTQFTLEVQISFACQMVPQLEPADAGLEDVA